MFLQLQHNCLLLLSYFGHTVPRLLAQGAGPVSEFAIFGTAAFSVDSLLLVTYNQSDSAVGRTLSEVTE